MIRSTFSNYSDPEKYVKHYLGDIPDNDYDAIRRQAYTASGDNSLLCETLFFAESYAKRNNDVFYYFFVHRPSNTPWAPWMGVAHFEEIQFVFGRPIRVRKDYTGKEVQLSKKMVKIWTDFAKNGYPSNTFTWPKYSTKDHTYVDLDTGFNGLYGAYFGHIGTGTGPHLENCNLLRHHYGF